MGPAATSNYTLYFNDGITFSFPKTAAACTEGNATTGIGDKAKCKGVIDVNGEKNPNKVVNCDGADWDKGDDTCKVSNPTDIYPVVMYDQTILPATRAAEAVLYGAGKQRERAEGEARNKYLFVIISGDKFPAFFCEFSLGWSRAERANPSGRAGRYSRSIANNSVPEALHYIGTISDKTLSTDIAKPTNPSQSFRTKMFCHNNYTPHGFGA